MSSNHQQQQPVVQTILESFTRCFNPMSAGEFASAAASCSRPDTRCDRDATDTGVDGSRTSVNTPKNKLNKSGSSPHRASERLELNGKEWDDVFNEKPNRKPRSSDSRKKHPRKQPWGKEVETDVDYAEVVAKAKKAAHRMDPETLQERSYKRKLQIFRCRDSPEPQRPPKGQQSKSSSPSSKRNSITEDKATKDEEELLSDSEEDIINLTSRKRFACGGGIIGEERLGSNNDGPISSFAKFFNINHGPMPFVNGLCFATPVRTASIENIQNLSDDKLTADEFIRRHGGNPAETPDLEKSIDGSIGESVSKGEDDTITSTLYFDQKYSHIVQTRPPMPLYHSQLVPTDDYRSDELTKIIKEKQRAEAKGEHYRGYTSRSPPKVLLTSKPKKPIFSKTHPASREDETPRSGHRNMKNRKHLKNEAPPSPLRLTGKSSSVSISTESGDMNQSTVRPMRSPDMVHPTAAEI